FSLQLFQTMLHMILGFGCKTYEHFPILMLTKFAKDVGCGLQMKREVALGLFYLLLRNRFRAVVEGSSGFDHHVGINAIFEHRAMHLFGCPNTNHAWKLKLAWPRHKHNVGSAIAGSLRDCIAHFPG